MGRSAGRPDAGRATPRRSAAAAGSRGKASSRRSGHAAPARRRPRAGQRVSWSRRVGIAAALVLAAASVALAGQALQPTGPPPAGSGPPPATSPARDATPRPAADRLPDAPLLEPPATAAVTTPTIEVAGRLVQQLERDGRHRLRIYVNGELVRDRRLPRRDAFRLPNIPLGEGNNTVTAAVAGPAGEGLHSAPIEVVLDTIVPAITLHEPPTSPVYTSEVVLRGSTEPGATLTVRVGASDDERLVALGADGSFELSVQLSPGPNELNLEARDAAGNVTRSALMLERREGSPSVQLSLSRESIAHSSLPTTLTLRTQVRDPGGAPIDGAQVTLSISPPGLPTQTHQTSTRNGDATWSGIRISTAAQAGQGLATVLVVLPGGETLQESVYFTIE